MRYLNIIPHNNYYIHIRSYCDENIKIFWRSLLAVVLSLSSTTTFAFDTGKLVDLGRAISIRPGPVVRISFPAG
ncbi:MAG: hypothetical protein R3E08_11960 [Thiotrichaceae bacterium]